MKPHMTLFGLFVLCLPFLQADGEKSILKLAADIGAVVVNERAESIYPILLAVPAAPGTSANHTAAAIALAMALAVSIAVVIIMAGWKNKPNHGHSAAMWLLFLMIILLIISIVLILIKEPGLKPHPLADPVRAAPVQILDTRSNESVFILIAIAFASGTMLWLSSLRKIGHLHAGPIVATIASAIFIILGGLYLLFCVSCIF